MPKSRKSPKNASRLFANLQKTVSYRVAKRIDSAPPEAFRKLTPKELEKLGRSRTSERYVEVGARLINKRTPTISKRQFQEKRLGVSLEQRAKQYLSGERAPTTALQNELIAKAKRAVEMKGAYRKYPNETRQRVREHLQNLATKRNSDWLDDEAWLREKAFCEAHMHVPEDAEAYRAWFNYGHVKVIRLAA